MSDVSFGWRLFDLLTLSKDTAENVKFINGFNPDRDILFIPPLENKSFFDAVNDLSICRKTEVRNFIYLYLTSGREYVINAIGRSVPYAGPVRDTLKEYGDIPCDLALLPLLESGFNPQAVSRSNAVGPWQFLKGTSKVLGLKSDKWVDERKDMVKSTRAAARHLKNLYSIFKDWELTLAAYNGGAGYVKRAMIRTGKKNLDDLRKSGALRVETSEYAARFAALMVIYKNQELFGIAEEVGEPGKTGVMTDTERLVLEFPADLRDVAEKSGVPVETIRELNPELKTNLTPPYAREYALRLPADAVKLLEPDRDALYAVKFSALKTHTVRRGECLNTISRRYNTTPRVIMRLNDIGESARLRPGQTLYIPILLTSSRPERRAPS
jgi:membrane-bound lytic murein transglycosylase D